MRRNYEDPVYKDWRKKVYKRDGFKCQMPQCNSNFRLQAHHIKKWSSAAALRYEVDNGITLCRECHEKVNGFESHYEYIFNTIVSQKNAKKRKST
jgi:5-methylcytosine-specific restriction endonuclease McrA